MKINNSRFVTSAYESDDFPWNKLPEFAFSGRSNVGKSSMINNLLNRKKLAHTGSTPGKTQCINFYNIDNKLYFVDLPGYGFARVPDSVRDSWDELINEYLYNRKNLHGVIQIIDIRHAPTETDCLMVKWLKEVGLPFLVVGTKTDKISRSKYHKKSKLIKEKVKIDDDKFGPVLFSAKTGMGKNKIFSFIKRELDYQ